MAIYPKITTNRPEEELLTAVVVRAHADLFSEQEVIRDEAVAWILSTDGSQALSFVWTCLQLKLSSTTVNRIVHDAERIRDGKRSEFERRTIGPKVLFV